MSVEAWGDNMHREWVNTKILWNRKKFVIFTVQHITFSCQLNTFKNPKLWGLDRRKQMHMYKLPLFMRVYMLGGIGAGGEGDDGGWDGWMASLTWWTWVWVNSGSWWWTRRPGVLWFMGSQRVGHDWVTELNWYVTRQLDKWVIWNHENSSFNWTLKGKKKNKNITESHIMV